MNFRGFRIHVALLALVVTLAGLAGAALLYRQQHLAGPLARELGAVAPVKALAVDYVNRLPVIGLTLGAVPDLSATYTLLDGVAQRTYGAGGYRLEIRGEQTSTLDVFYARAQLLLWQAVQQGDYAAMSDAIAAEARNAGLTGARLGVTAERVFLQADDGADHHLYVVVPRQIGGGAK